MMTPEKKKGHGQGEGQGPARGGVGDEAMGLNKYCFAAALGDSHLLD